ncbi:uncharacterized protein LOC128176227 isoform X2 [Crassostrea angulata]|uniref:uncharacterized protein LOC128176227 isoform X2 n=1 Tax=Magallana angulata TaxID=2784310 RepID=UPI0022B0FC0A|nr:uncharacterized protein LOC128176227 isoform X2 [Crassostrea angulata]
MASFHGEHLDNMPRSNERRERSYRGSAYSSFQGVQEPEIDYKDNTKENEVPGIHQSTDCYIPRGYRFNHRTFREQPIPPLSPLDQQQQNVRGTGGVMNTQGTITGVSQNSNECDNPGNSDRVQKSHSSTFLPQPVTPLLSLSQIQKNILSHSDTEKRRLQYDNAWNILGKGDSRLSNHYGPSVTTKQLNTSYVFVGSVQETSREVKLPPTPSSGLTDDTSQYSLDTKDYKPRSKKICKYLLWILIILGISAVVAISTVYYQNSQPNQITNSMEAQIDGTNEINKTLGIVLDKFSSIKQSIESMKSLVKEINKPLNRAPAYTSSDSLSDSSNSGQCRNDTNGECVKDCTFMCRGDYQSCETCIGYVTCDHGKIFKRICVNPRFNITLFWDDKLKACEFKSSTCYYK